MMRECIVCGGSCEEEMKASNKTIPAVNSGIVCRATGNYGSSEYDPMEGHEFVEFIICDECFIKKAKIIDRISLKEDETIGVRETFDAYKLRLANIRRTNGEQ